MKYQAAAAIVAPTTEFVKPGHPSPFPRDRTRERLASSKLAALYLVSPPGSQFRAKVSREATRTWS